MTAPARPSGPTARPDVLSPPPNEAQQAQQLLHSQLRRLVDDVTIARVRSLPVDDLLRLRLREVCAGARDAELTVEQVLITLKEEWHAGAEYRRLSPAEGTRLLTRVVTLCIHAYYDAVRPH